MHGRELLRWCRDPTRVVYLQCRVLFKFWCRHDVRWDGAVMYCLHSWQFLRGQCRSAGGVHVYCGVRLDEHDVEWVYDYNGDVCDMSRW